jgi:DNA-binding XRE family transcriptional regulator
MPPMPELRAYGPYLLPGVRVHRTAIKPEFRAGQDDSLGAQLRATRRQRGLTLAEAADMIGVRRWTLGLWENGVQEPQVHLRPAIVRFLK